jgi:hypothetical protein
MKLLTWGLALTVVTYGAWAQEGEAKHGSAAKPGEAHEPHEEKEEIEAEFVASSIFRSGSYVHTVWKELGFEGHYFGGKHVDTGHVGASWTFKLGELELAPGFGVLFGSNQFTTSPAVTLRWDYEKKWFVTQGLIVRGFRSSPVFAEEEHGGHSRSSAPEEPVGSVRPVISDGNHVSARWKRLTVGPTWEHIHFREGDEWKWGGRVAFRLLPRVSALLFVLTPGKTEWRGGVMFHPKQGE